MQFIAGLMFAGNLLLDPLLDERILNLDAAIALARNLAGVEPLLDVRLMQKMLADVRGDVQAVRAPVALRVMLLAEAISDCSRLSSFLMLMMRHDDAEVRAEAALLLSISSYNLNRIKVFAASENPLLRATAMEALWGRREAESLALLHEATKDANRRVFLVALIGLARGGDAEAARRLKDLGRSEGPLVEAAAQWAAGEIDDAGLAAKLQPLEQSPDPFVRTIAQRRLRKLRVKGLSPARR